jgi:5-methyltetrahydrofolate--homocysteine methyltransferase
MQTKLYGKNGKEVIISPDFPTVIIGERINPSGGTRKKITKALVDRDNQYIQSLALAQVEAGADILDVNVQAGDVKNEPETLVWAVETIASAVDTPLVIDTNNISAMEAALKVAPGRALINSVNGEEESLQRVLPLAAEYGSAVIGLTMDENGIPDDAQTRFAIAEKIMHRANKLGIREEDIIIDTLTLTVGANHKAAKITLDAMQLVRNNLGLNLTAGASNVSFGLPRRQLLNEVFLAMAIANGLNCAIVNPAQTRSIILAADLLAGKDEYASSFLEDYRREQY